MLKWKDKVGPAQQNWDRHVALFDWMEIENDLKIRILSDVNAQILNLKIWIILKLYIVYTIEIFNFFIFNGFVQHWSQFFKSILGGKFLFGIGSVIYQ